MRAFVMVLGMVLSSASWGHGVHATEPGFGGGLLHPMTGFDHLLAAIGMGLWLSLQRFKPLSIFLYCGALLSGVAVALLMRGMIGDFEWMLAVSLILLGLFLIKPLRMPRQLVATVITLVFSCHFYAHLSEASLSAFAPGYIPGLFTGTFLLVMISAAIGLRLSPGWLHIAGVAIAAAGVAALGLA